MNDYGVKYEFDGSSYYVSDNRTLNRQEVTILGSYTDGIHGEHPVTFVKNSAFAGNAILRKITLPQSVTRLDGGVFLSCENLEYVSMTGITDMAFVNLSNTGIYQGLQVDTGNNFLDCYKLKTLIVNEKFNLYAAAEAQQFLGRDRRDQNNKVIKAVPCADIYSIGSFANSEIKAAPNGKIICLRELCSIKAISINAEDGTTLTEKSKVRLGNTIILTAFARFAAKRCDGRSLRLQCGERRILRGGV